MAADRASRFPLPPGSVVGILGGGQLARLLAAAAADLGLEAVVYSDLDDAPAFATARDRIVADYRDAEALGRLARMADVVTCEFENVPAETVSILADLGAPVAPGARALAVAQDRLDEKAFIGSIGAQTAPFWRIDGPDDLAAACGAADGPGILKTRRLGYDGKGQVRLSSGADAAEQAEALRAIAAAPAILEGLVDFEREISIIAARGRDGSLAFFDPAENTHREGILRRSVAPARAPKAVLARASEIASAMLTALDYVGVMGVEFFVPRGGGELIVNEFAPRVHNSGHWTLDACGCSQFEMHIRAVCGWTLGDGARHSDAVMDNLIGAEADDWARIAADPAARLYLYGKGEARPGRKMGHVTRLSART